MFTWERTGKTYRALYRKVAGVRLSEEDAHLLAFSEDLASPAKITIAAVPKPFAGHFGVIQKNAIQSWLALRPQPQVILFGNEEGTAAIASELGLEHVPNPACSEYGTPLLDDIIATTRKRSIHDLLCYVNADIILLPEWTRALKAVRQQMERFLVVARRLNVDVTERVNLENRNEPKVRKLLAGGSRGPQYAIDVFVFPKKIYQHVPPFCIGRPWFDRWFIKAARGEKLPLIDVTPVAPAVHQNHDYSHVKGGLNWVWAGGEGQRTWLFTAKSQATGSPFSTPPTNSFPQVESGGPSCGISCGDVSLTPRT